MIITVCLNFLSQMIDTINIVLKKVSFRSKIVVPEIYVWDCHKI